MTTITSVAAGAWEDTSTWDTATVPTSSDDVVLYHQVTIASAAVCSTLSFRAGGGIGIPPGNDPLTAVSLTISASIIFYSAEATGTIRTDGIIINAPFTGLVTYAPASGSIPVIFNVGSNLMSGEAVIVSDPGYISASARLQDIQPEGCAQAYTRKVSNGVRYATVTLMIRATYLNLIGRLLRIVEAPYPVLLVTDTFMMKGYVESAVTDANSVGKEYITYKVTVAEAL